LTDSLKNGIFKPKSVILKAAKARNYRRRNKKEILNTMDSSTVATLVGSLTTSVMGSLATLAVPIFGAFALLISLGFGIYLFRKYVFKKKI
jgi:preprotein translocase subunit SecF